MPSITNGTLDFSQLADVGGGRQLRNDCATSWFRLCVDVKARCGWNPSLSAGASAYRTVAAQIEQFLGRYVQNANRANLGPYKDVRYWMGRRYIRVSNKGAAAIPGTSNHGEGLAVDVANLGGFSGTRYRQFAAVAASHGWSNTEGRSVGEPWHWVYNPQADQHIPAPVYISPTTKEDDDEMLVIAKLRNSPHIYVGNGITRTRVPNVQALNDLIHRIRIGSFKGDPNLQIVDTIDWLGKEV